MGPEVFRSDDGGANWSLSTKNMPQRLIAYSILQDQLDGNVIYLGTNYGLYRSTDRGAMPAKESENIRPTVTAGLAKLVELVNQYAAVM